MKSIKLMLCGIMMVVISVFVLSIDIADTGANTDIAFVLCVIGILIFAAGLLLPVDYDKKLNSTLNPNDLLNPTCPKCGTHRHIGDNYCTCCNYKYPDTQ